MNFAALPLPVFEPLRASRAVAALLRDPDDLPQVFTILEALSGTTPRRLARGFRRTAEGRRLLDGRVDIVPALTDRAALRALPEGTLGRAYLAFLESEGISAEGIRDASERGESGHPRHDDLAYVHQRMRDTHDLWHAATGYKGDVVGETALLAFSLAQTWNPGVALIVAAALLRARQRAFAEAVLDGWRRGRAAAWLPSQDWESMLALPLDEVRRRLGLGPAPVYTEVRAAQVRATA